MTAFDEICVKQTGILRSMTGYVSQEIAIEGQPRLYLEIQSLNRKHLDVTTHLPKRLFHLDLIFRKEAAQWIRRGMVTLKISERGPRESVCLEEMIHQLSSLKTTWSAIAERLGVDSSFITVPFLLGFLGESHVAASDMDQLILGHVREGFKLLVESKTSEGTLLGRDLQLRLNQMRESLERIEEQSDTAIIRYQGKLDKLLSQVGIIDRVNGDGRYATLIQDERILKEIALFADKIDVSEEKVRLAAHIDAFEKIITEATPEDSRGTMGKSMGLSLEFLLQEMQREVNTLGSKVTELHLSQEVLNMKGLLGQLKEQVANIE